MISEPRERDKTSRYGSLSRTPLGAMYNGFLDTKNQDLLVLSLNAGLMS